MPQRPRLDPDLRRRAEAARDEFENNMRLIREQAADRREKRLQRLKQERARSSLGQLAKRYGVSRSRIVQMLREARAC